MAYAIMRINKISKFQQIWAVQRHQDDRTRLESRSRPENDNVIISIKEENKYLADMVRDRLSQCNVKQKSNSIRMVEILLAYSPEALQDKNFNERKWVDASKLWVEQTFGKENVLEIRMDRDEKTNHLHCYVTPITEDGRLCCKDWTGGKVKLSKLQDTYAEAVKDVGLIRGQSFVKDPSKKTRKHIKTATYNFIKSQILSEEAQKAQEEILHKEQKEKTPGEYIASGFDDLN